AAREAVRERGQKQGDLAIVGDRAIEQREQSLDLRVLELDARAAVVLARAGFVVAGLGGLELAELMLGDREAGELVERSSPDLPAVTMHGRPLEQQIGDPARRRAHAPRGLHGRLRIERSLAELAHGRQRAVALLGVLAREEPE